MFRRRSRAPRRAKPPSWSTPWRATRVLIEHADPVVRADLQTRLRADGYDPIGCGGPSEREYCPLLAHEPCPAVTQADVVVSGLVDERSGRLIASTILDKYPGRPLLLTGDRRTLAVVGSRLLARGAHLVPEGVETGPAIDRPSQTADPGGSGGPLGET